jgi:hypothetical protein
MIIIKAKVVCDAYGCKEKINVDMSISIGDQGVPIVEIVDKPEDWIISMERYNKYSFFGKNDYDKCLCPHHKKKDKLF